MSGIQTTYPQSPVNALKNFDFYTRLRWPAVRQENRQISTIPVPIILLWRRGRPSRYHPHLPSRGSRLRRVATELARPTDRVSRTRAIARLLDASLHRKGRHP